MKQKSSPRFWASPAREKKIASQEVLRQSLNVYLRTQLPTLDSTSQPIGGKFCFGLSIIIGTLFLDGLSAWWSKLLSAIIVNQSMLSEEAYLSDPASDWHLNDLKPTRQTHQQLIDRALHYILFNNANTCCFPTSDLKQLRHTLRQQTFLDFKQPNPYLGFEYLSKGGELWLPQNKHTIASYFNAHLLSEVLTPSEFQDDLLILSNSEHACTLVYDKKEAKYGFYDPDTHVTDFLWFSSKLDCTRHIISALGNSIALSLIQFRQTDCAPFRSFKVQFSKESFQNQMFKTYSLPFIARYAPKLAIELVKSPSASTQVNQQRIAKSLFETMVQGWAGFLIIGRYSDTLLKTLILRFKPDSIYIKEIFSKLTSKTETHDSYLYILLLSAPNSLKALLAKSSTQPHLKDQLVLALDDIDDDRLEILRNNKGPSKVVFHEIIQAADEHRETLLESVSVKTAAL